MEDFSVWISLISLLISGALAVDKWLSYRLKINLDKVEFHFIGNTGFFIHFYIANRSSRNVGIYDIDISNSYLKKHSHKIVSSNLNPKSEIYTSEFPINLMPWEQGEILLEFTTKKKNSFGDRIGPKLGDTIVAKIYTNRGTKYIPLEIPNKSIDITHLTDEW